MSKISLIFIATAFLLLPLGEIEGFFYEQIEIIACAMLIATFGISHGAIDNYLYGFKNQSENLRFIAVYVAAAGLFGLFWWVDADLAFLSFILISAYHFGQSQFVDLDQKNRWKDRFLYTAWGGTLLMAYLLFNQTELAASYQDSDLSMPVMTLSIEYALELFVSFFLLLVFLLGERFMRQEITLQRLLVEVYQLGIISIVFYISSPLLGFTLYFVILHSLRVLQQEYQFLQKDQALPSLTSFIKLLLPFTLLSLVGLGFFAALVYFFELSFSWPLVSIIFISCLTFPHSFVMDWFYGREG